MSNPILNQSDWQHRTRMILGDEGLKHLQNAHILIVGVGGVGSFSAEALARAGVGHLTLVDHDIVSSTNRNRQIQALSSTEGMLKVEILGQRLKEINPEIELTLIPEFLQDQKLETIIQKNSFNYIIDAIDSLSPKAYLIFHALKNQIPIISSLGTAGKLDPSLIQITTLKKTFQCPLARALRKKVQQLGVDLNQVRTVFSSEPICGETEEFESGFDNLTSKRSFRGTISYIPAIFGLFAASEVIRHLSFPIKQN